MNENLTIKTIICKPKNLEKYEYIINNNHKHYLKKNDLIDFLNKHIKGHLYKISKLIRDNLPFIVLIKENEILELKFDFEKELSLLKDENKNLDNIIKNIKKEKNNNDSYNKNNNNLDKYVYLDISKLIK